MMLEVCWDSLWTLSLGLSQFHGHSSWLVCKLALSSHLLLEQLHGTPSMEGKSMPFVLISPCLTLMLVKLAVNQMKKVNERVNEG